MGQSYYTNNLSQAGNYYGPYSNFGNPATSRKYGYNEGPPIIGPMQAGGYGKNGYGPSDSPTDLRLSQELSDVDRLQAMVDRKIGAQSSNSKDNNDPLAYVNQRIAPIVNKAKETYDEAIKSSGGKDQSKKSDNKQSSNSKAPGSVPLDSSSGG